MRRATGIGGIVFKSRHPAARQARYRSCLCIDVQPRGGAALADYAKFGGVVDPEGNKVELREPPEGR